MNYLQFIQLFQLNANVFQFVTIYLKENNTPINTICNFFSIFLYLKKVSYL